VTALDALLCSARAGLWQRGDTGRAFGPITAALTRDDLETVLAEAVTRLLDADWERAGRGR